MGRPNTIIRDWLQAATPDEARQLAKAAKTSVPHLRHIAKGRRGISADLAQRLAHASGGLPTVLALYQTQLCDACKRCPLVPAKSK
jgi:plasmid maintenance system antidote protein VapI